MHHISKRGACYSAANQAPTAERREGIKGHTATPTLPPFFALSFPTPPLLSNNTPFKDLETRSPVSPPFKSVICARCEVTCNELGLTSHSSSAGSLQCAGFPLHSSSVRRKSRAIMHTWADCHLRGPLRTKPEPKPLWSFLQPHVHQRCPALAVCVCAER